MTHRSKILMTIENCTFGGEPDVSPESWYWLYSDEVYPNPGVVYVTSDMEVLVVGDERTIDLEDLPDATLEGPIRPPRSGVLRARGD